MYLHTDWRMAKREGCYCKVLPCFNFSSFDSSVSSFSQWASIKTYSWAWFGQPVMNPSYFTFPKQLMIWPINAYVIRGRTVLWEGLQERWKEGSLLPSAGCCSSRSLPIVGHCHCLLLSFPNLLRVHHVPLPWSFGTVLSSIGPSSLCWEVSPLTVCQMDCV